MSIRLFATALALALLAAACGGDGDSATEATSSGDQANAGPTSEPATTLEPEPTSTPEPIAEPTATPEPTAIPEPVPVVSIAADGLPALGGGAVYEAWLIVDEMPVSIGTFDSIEGGIELAVDPDTTATAVVITIELDDDPAPADTHVLAGTIADGVAQLTVTDTAAIGVDFSESRGDYILGTPTDGNGPPENERSGIWWTFIPRSQSLFLPELPAGWIYEAWQVIDGVPVSSGTFDVLFGAADNAAPFSGPQPGPPFPGEDFLMNAPTGLMFPVDLRGSEVVITVEPLPDDSADPFPVVPLRGFVPDDAIDHTAYPVANVSDSLPTGTATFS
ncbi:MAG: anti-sigma factor domain-containing protein [Acidimicrobiales bacterium]